MLYTSAACRGTGTCSGNAMFIALLYGAAIALKHVKPTGTSGTQENRYDAPLANTMSREAEGAELLRRTRREHRGACHRFCAG